MRGASIAGIVAVSALMAAVPRAQTPPDRGSADAFVATLQRAIDSHDARGVAALTRFPMSAMIGVFRIPFADSIAFVKSYDSIFTPTFRCRVSDAIATRSFTATPDGIAIAGASIYAERAGGRFTITRLIAPAAPATPALPPPRRVALTGAAPARFLGRLERDDYDRFILHATSSERLDVAITGFRGHDAELRVLDDETGATIATNLHVGPRDWSGFVSRGDTYRIEVQRRAPYCAPAVDYRIDIAHTLR